MRKRMLLIATIALGMALLLGSCAKHPTSSSDQLIVVCTKNWTSSKGILQRFDRSPRGNWEPAGEIVPARIGRNGMGWGVGLRQPDADTNPQKREGDLKTPAGLFWVSAVFGKDPEYKEKCKMPFIHVGPNTEAVDDPKSRYYNQIVNADLVEEKDWDSSEKMYEISLYDVGMVVNHNSPVQDSNAGSCIFIHKWRAPHKPTTGCVALAADNLRELAEWLDMKKKLTIVILPMKEYRSHMLKWSLHRPMPFGECLAPTE